MGKLSPKTQMIIKSLVWIVLVVLFVILFFTKVIGYIAPFLVAILITFIIEKPVELLTKKIEISPWNRCCNCTFSICDAVWRHHNFCFL